MPLVYNPVKQKVTMPDGRTVDFFCGFDLDDIAITVLELNFGNITPQEAYIIFLKKFKNT